MSDEDHKIPPIRIDQTMSILAMSTMATITQLCIKPEDTEEEKVARTYLCLGIFFHQLTSGAKHKDKMAGVLRAVLAELEEQMKEASNA